MRGGALVPEGYHILPLKRKYSPTRALTSFRMGEAPAAGTTSSSHSGERRMLVTNQNWVARGTGKALQGSKSSSRLYIQGECQLKPKRTWNLRPKGQIQGQSGQFNAINGVPLALNSLMCPSSQPGLPSCQLFDLGQIRNHSMSQPPYPKTASSNICLELQLLRSTYKV